MEQEIKEAAARMGEYRQYFAWAAVQLFAESGELILHDNVEMKNLTRVKGDIYSHITEMEKNKQVLTSFSHWHDRSYRHCVLDRWND